MPHLVTLPPLAVALAPFGVGYALGALVRRVGHGVRARRAPAPLTRAQQRGQAGEAAVSARFTRRADDLLLRFGTGRYSQIDHLALTPHGILVLESKNLGGLLYGAPDRPYWTQVIGPQRHAFYNPLKQNATHLAAVRRYAGTVPVRGLVVFMDRGVFPEGHPAGTVALRALAATLEPLAAGRIPYRYRRAWRRVLAAHQASPQARQAHAAYVAGRVRTRPGARAGVTADTPRTRRWWLPWLVLLLAGALPAPVAG